MQHFRLYLTVCSLLTLPLADSVAQQTPIMLDAAARFDGAFAPVVHQGRKVYLHHSGNILADRVEDGTSNGGNIVRKGGFAGVIDSSGRVIIPFEYDDIEQDYDHHFFKLKKNGKMGAADSTGQVRAQPVYDNIDDLNGSAVAFKRGKQYGWVSLTDGKEHASPGELSQSHISEDIFYLEEGQLRGLVHANGQQIAPVKYDMLYNGYPGTIIVQLDNKAGLIDLSGKEICKPIYDQINTACCGESVMRVKINDKTGLINPQGILTAPAKFDDIQRFNYGQAIAVQNNLRGVITTTGRTIIPFQYNEIRTTDALGREMLDYAEKREVKDSFRAYIVQKEGKYGLLSWKGKVLLPPEYTAVAVGTMNNRAYVFASKGNKMGLFSQEGKALIPVRYDELYHAAVSNSSFTYYTTDASHNAAQQMVRAVDGKYSGLFSLTGETIVPVQYESLRWESNGLLELQNGDTTTIATATGKIVCKPALKKYYYMAAPDRIIETSDTGYHLTDLDGNLIYDLQSWDHRNAQNAIGDADLFYAGLLKITDYRYRNRFITKTGKPVEFPQYTQVNVFYNGLAVAFKGDKVGFIDSTGKEVIPVVWDDIRNVGNHSNEYKKVTQNNQLGLINRSGKLLLPVAYSRINEIMPGYFVFTKAQLQGMADSTGKVILEPEYSEISVNTSIQRITLRKGNKTGLATLNGEIILPAEYDTMEFNYGWKSDGWPILVKKDNTLQYILENGKALPVTAKKAL